MTKGKEFIEELVSLSFFSFSKAELVAKLQTLATRVSAESKNVENCGLSQDSKKLSKLGENCSELANQLTQDELRSFSSLKRRINEIQKEFFLSVDIINQDKESISNIPVKVHIQPLEKSLALIKAPLSVVMKAPLGRYRHLVKKLNGVYYGNIGYIVFPEVSVLVLNLEKIEAYGDVEEISQEVLSQLISNKDRIPVPFHDYAWQQRKLYAVPCFRREYVNMLHAFFDTVARDVRLLIS